MRKRISILLQIDGTPEQEEEINQFPLREVILELLEILSLKEVQRSIIKKYKENGQMDKLKDKFARFNLLENALKLRKKAGRKRKPILQEGEVE